MVKLSPLLLTFPVFLFAGEFTASVSSAQVDLHEGFTLNLTLKDTTPKDAPAISALTKHFTILSEHHSTNRNIINGKRSSSITWKFSLSPKTEGSLEIPPITINTEEGPLTTQSISLNVIKDSKSDDIGLNISTKTSHAAPYKNEPFIYTALLTSITPLYNVQTEKLQVEGAIVEFIGQPKLEEKVIGGVLHNVVEFSYLITPLNVGPLIIPSVAVQGGIAQQRDDPFAFMQGFGRLQPFRLTTDKVPLDVQPPLAEVSPWLVAKALTLEEQWPGDQTFRVGEPLSRGFQIKAEGLKASQLPHLDQTHGTTFKVYADKPEEQEQVLQGAIHSMRKEHYTLIPQEAGALEFPEIAISWWDSSKKQKRTSTVPARTLQILPAFETEEIASAAPAATEAPISPAQPPYILYGIIGVLTFLLSAALLWGFTLQRKIASLTKGPSQKPQKPKKSPPVTAVQKEKKEKLPDLNPT